jgi:ferredoxin
MPYVITEPCVSTKDGACAEVCPTSSIHAASDQYYIDPDTCIDCGACEPECPVQAIFPETQVPSKWASYINTNRTLAEQKK